jgi:hypothetical protein
MVTPATKATKLMIKENRINDHPGPSVIEPIGIGTIVVNQSSRARSAPIRIKDMVSARFVICSFLLRRAPVTTPIRIGDPKQNTRRIASIHHSKPDTQNTGKHYIYSRVLNL